MMDAQQLLGLWDELRFGMLVHRTVADVRGYSVDLSAGFSERAERALAELLAHDATSDHKASRADAVRRQAILSAYLRAPEDELRLIFDRADDGYRQVVESSGGLLADEFSRTLLSLERTLTLRVCGHLTAMDAPADASPERLHRIGLAHLVDVVRADRLANRLYLGTSDDVDATLHEAAGHPAHRRERAYLQLCNALCHLADDRRAEADEATLLAIELQSAGHYGLFDQMERHVDDLFARFLWGFTAQSDEAGIESFDLAVSLIEDVRGGWRLGGTRSDPLWAPFEQIMIEALRAACLSEVGSSAWTALRIMEAMRRRHLAGMLRAARFRPESSRIARRSTIVSVTDLVSLEEDRVVTLAGRTAAAGIQGGARTRFTKSSDTVSTLDEPDPLFERHRIEDARDEMSRLVSDFFADAFLPERVQQAALRDSVAGRFALEFLFLDDSSVARCWVDPSGAAHADVTTLGSTRDHLEEMDFTGLDAAVVRRILGRTRKYADVDLIESISAALLPGALRAQLADAPAPVDLVIVPDAWLSSVSWAALTSATGRRLIDVADILLIPGLSLVEQEHADAAVERRVVVSSCVEYRPGPRWQPLALDQERTYLERTCPPVSNSIHDWLDRLSAADPPAHWAFIACHGDDPLWGPNKPVVTGSTPSGFGAELVDDDESRVTVLDMMTIDWPQLVVFAGCFTGRLGWNVASGLAPLGLAVAVMARGASSVIGGADLLPDPATSMLFVDKDGVFDRLLGSSLHPGRVLAAAQRALLQLRPAAPPIVWARNVTITRQLPATR